MEITNIRHIPAAEEDEVYEINVFNPIGLKSYSAMIKH